METCRCQVDTETTAQFLLHCNIFAAERNKMFQEIIRPILESKRLGLPMGMITLALMKIELY